ncbi:MAG: metallophosphoesterase [Candidatus Thermoplasmatota archaeon]|nr:metallophosphoesterase [Candidatus Thermoplasmatota archaeon]
MELYEGVEIIESYPALYIEQIDAIVISDLHLGYESIAAEGGVMLPKVQLEDAIRKMQKIVKLKESRRIIICGDIKHEFSETTYHESMEVIDFIDFLHEAFEEVLLIKGNHDTFINRVARRKDVKVYDRHSEGGFLFIHGDKDIDLNIKGKFLIMGHEHPSIVLYDSINREKMKCFLYGEYGGKNIIVMPAFSYFALGSDINTMSPLSPILRRMGIGSFRAIGLIEGESLLSFPEIDRISNLS